VLETPFGWHVIRRVGGNASAASPSDAGAPSLEDVVRIRVQQAIETVLQTQRARSLVVVDPSADLFMARVVGDDR
jgi:hypothetical protein